MKNAYIDIFTNFQIEYIHYSCRTLFCITAFCSRMLRASHVLSILPSKGTSDRSITFYLLHGFLQLDAVAFRTIRGFVYVLFGK